MQKAVLPFYLHVDMDIYAKFSKSFLCLAHSVCSFNQSFSHLSISLGEEGLSFSGMLTSLCLGPLGDVGKGPDLSPPVSLKQLTKLA